MACGRSNVFVLAFFRGKGVAREGRACVKVASNQYLW